MKSFNGVCSKFSTSRQLIKEHLSGKAKAGGYSRHRNGHEVVEITVGWSRQFQCAETDVVQSLVIDTERLVRVLDKLMD